MLVTDLMHSCANDRVAEAAVSSIGGEFASRIQSEADDDGVSMGRFASQMVREFSMSATEREWRDLALAVRGQDHPVLAGLQLILTRRLATLEVYGASSRSALRRDVSTGFAAAALA